MSVRQLSELAGGIHYVTVSRALHWLADMCFLYPIKSQEYHKGKLFQIAATNMFNMQPLSKQTSNNATFKHMTVQHDRPVEKFSYVYKRGVLGSSAAVMVMPYLSDSGVTVAEIVQASGKSDGTIRSSLKKLEAVGLAQRTGGRPQLWTRGPRLIEEVEEELNAKDIEDAIKKRHQKDRNEWTKKLIKWGVE
jgi:DNA-binding transcriptional ArsR family regulator